MSVTPAALMRPGRLKQCSLSANLYTFDFISSSCPVKLGLHQCEFEILTANIGDYFKFSLVETTCINFFSENFQNYYHA